MRELNKEKGEYDAFITTGGIQEVRPPSPMHGGGRAQPLSPYNHQKPAVAKDIEDTEYFGMLVTPDTVKMLDYPSTTNVNVSLSTLLVAASSRMPWLLVLRRADYPQLFEYQHQPTAATAATASAGIPGMQIPQRRRYYSDRRRRGLYLAPYGQRTNYDDDEPTGRKIPPAFERELLSTMCYNFVRDYASAGDDLPRLPIALADPEVTDHRRRNEARDDREVFIDTDAYAAAASAAPTSTSPPNDQQSSSPVQMTIPKRIS